MAANVAQVCGGAATPPRCGCATRQGGFSAPQAAQPVAGALPGRASALRELRNAIARWQQMLERRSSQEKASFDQFELLAWRTLGEALLLIDMYEHQSEPQSELPEPPARKGSAWQRARAWLGRLRR